MALAQKARQAKVKGESAPPTPSVEPEQPKAKRRISEEGMKRIIAATKKRWRLAKAAKAQAAAAKKPASVAKRTAVKKAVKAPAKTARKTAPVRSAKASEKKAGSVPAETNTPVE